MKLEELFNQKLTENGDIAFTKVSDDQMLNILFLTEYYQKHLNELPTLGQSEIEQLFAMFIRDPRFGLGKRDLGRHLLYETQCGIDQIIKAGRIDDLFFAFGNDRQVWDWCKEEIIKGNESFFYFHIRSWDIKTIVMIRGCYPHYLRAS